MYVIKRKTILDKAARKTTLQTESLQPKNGWNEGIICCWERVGRQVFWLIGEERTDILLVILMQERI